MEIPSDPKVQTQACLFHNFSLFFDLYLFKKKNLSDMEIAGVILWSK